MIFISPVGVASGGTPWVVRRSAFVTRKTSGIGGGVMDRALAT